MPPAPDCAHHLDVQLDTLAVAIAHLRDEDFADAATELERLHHVLQAQAARAAASLKAAAYSTTSRRWVRRAPAGANLAGLGHLTRAWPEPGQRDVRAVCGRRLVGTLDWGSAAASPPNTWRHCPDCADAVFVAATAAAAQAATR